MHAAQVKVRISCLVFIIQFGIQIEVAKLRKKIHSGADDILK